MRFLFFLWRWKFSALAVMASCLLGYFVGAEMAPLGAAIGFAGGTADMLLRDDV